MTAFNSKQTQEHLNLSTLMNRRSSFDLSLRLFPLSSRFPRINIRRISPRLPIISQRNPPTSSASVALTRLVHYDGKFWMLTIRGPITANINLLWTMLACGHIWHCDWFYWVFDKQIEVIIWQAVPFFLYCRVCFYIHCNENTQAHTLTLWITLKPNAE